MGRGGIVTRLLKDKAMWAAIMAAPVVLCGLFWWWPELRATTVRWPKEGVMVILLMPLLEELAFRGYLQGRLVAPSIQRFSIHNVSGQNLITTIIFSAFHLISHTWLWSLAVAIPSLSFGFFRDKYQSVIPAVILHVYYNAVYFYLFAN